MRLALLSDSFLVGAAEAMDGCGLYAVDPFADYLKSIVSEEKIMVIIANQMDCSAHFI